METTLLSKVAMLLTGSMLLGSLGCYFGRNLQSMAAFITLMVLFIGGSIAVFFLAGVSPAVGISALFLWTFIAGLFIGPAIQGYSESLGWQTVFLAFAGTGGVMAVTGAIGMFSGIDFSGFAPYLMVALLVLIGVGIVACFVAMSRDVNIIWGLGGMIVFAGFFLVDFHRVAKAENTWEEAIRITMSLYLDFLNFLLYLLKFLEAVNGK